MTNIPEINLRFFPVISQPSRWACVNRFPQETAAAGDAALTIRFGFGQSEETPWMKLKSGR